MVAFKGNKAQSAAAQPPDNISALLIYGPNAGLIRERAKAAVCYAVEDLADSFRLCELQAKDVGDDPARLADELGALAFAGGRRAIWLKDATDGLTKTVSEALENEFGDTLLVIEAGNLGPRSSLRKMFEGGSNLGAIPCYDDDHDSLRDYVSDFLRERRATIDSDAHYWLIERLGRDRMQVKNELDKLVLYASGDSTESSESEFRITLDTVIASSGDAGVWSLDQLAATVASGDLNEIDRSLYLAFEQGIQPVAALRAVARRFIQLHFVVGSVARGGTIDKTIGALRPPIFFKHRSAFRNQAMRWSLLRIAQALDILSSAEIECKSTGKPADKICARALISIGAAARAGSGRN